REGAVARSATSDWRRGARRAPPTRTRMRMSLERLAGAGGGGVEAVGELVSLQHSLEAAHGPTVDDAVAGDVATGRVQPRVAVLVGECAAGAGQDQRCSGDVPDLQLQRPVCVQ